MLRKCVLYGMPVIVIISWMLALSHLTVEETERPARTRPQQGAILCRCESRCDCGLTHNECPCEEIAKTIGDRPCGK